MGNWASSPKITIKKITKNMETNSLKTLEKEWRESSPYYSLRELVKIFPEARTILKDKLEKLETEAKELEVKVRGGLERTKRKSPDQETTSLRKEIIKTFLGEDLDNKIAKIKNLKFALSRKKKIRGVITEDEIDQARHFPFEKLIPFRNGFSICPFHSESKGSLHIIPNTNLVHCFGCGFTSDTIGFIQKKDNISFREAVRILI